MKMHWTKLKEILKRERKDIVIGGVLAISFLTSLLLFFHQCRVNKGLQRELAEVKKNQELNSIMDRLAKELPDGEDIPRILGGLASLGRESNVQAISISPQQATKGETYEEIPLEITGQATYHNLSIFLNRMEKSQALINVKELHLKKAGNEEILLNLRILASTYSKGE